MRAVLAIAALLAIAACAPIAKPPLAPAPSATPKPTPLPPLPPLDVPAEPGVAELNEGLLLLFESDAKHPEALAKLRAAIDHGLANPLGKYNVACLEAEAGRVDAAIDWLGKAVDAGWCRAAFTRDDATLAPAHGAAFDAVLKRMEERSTSGKCWEDPELSEIRDADQDDRRTTPIDWARVNARDTERRTRVIELLRQGRVRTAQDYENAALVFQHGDTLADYEQARALAYEGAKRGSRSALWLAAAAWDRWLVKAGHPQRFGTQFRCPKGAPCEVLPLDPATTVEERARWNVPEPSKQLEEMNAR